MKPILRENVNFENLDQELVTFAQSIDFTELFQHVKDYTKVDCNFSQPEITETRGSLYIGFQSDNIADQAGPFAAILEKCQLANFSNGVFRDKDTGEAGYWVQVSIQYEHKGGGSNGMEVTTARYTAAKGWAFRNVGR